MKTNDADNNELPILLGKRSMLSSRESSTSQRLNPKPNYQQIQSQFHPLLRKKSETKPPR